MQIQFRYLTFVLCVFLLLTGTCRAESFEDPDTSQTFSNDFGPYENEDNYSLQQTENDLYNSPREVRGYTPFRTRLPQHIPAMNEDAILIDPNVHAWGAYSKEGKLIRAGLATAGARWCDDIDRPCRTQAGIFRIRSMGDSECVSNEFPIDEGGAPMPYCMFFNGAQAIHGSNELAEANISHGCVRLKVEDAEWLRYHFAHVGTLVMVRRY